MEDNVGQQLGNYRLTRLLGEGGFAKVYLAEHIYLNTPAAIKLLNMQMSSNDVDSFLNEARTIARLIHPNIVRVLDFGVEANIPFLVLDYAPNGTLRQRHPRGIPLPLSTVVSYVAQVAEALQYAHDEKLIHRDVKPENMLLGRRKEVLLSDFGLALIAQSSRIESLQEITGTIAYMAPEQIQGNPRPASDQYALGIAVYEWLSGDRLFQGSFTEIVTQQLAVPPPSLRGKMPGIAPALEQVVLKALEKEPNKRFSSVREFALALEQASRLSTPISEQAEAPVVDKTTPPKDALTIPPQKSIPQANEAALVTLPPTPSPLSAPPVLSSLAVPPVQVLPLGTVICSYRGHLAPVRSLSWSPDSARIISVSGEKTVHVWDATTGSTLQSFQDASNSVLLVAYSTAVPGGIRVATAGIDARVRVWDVATNRLIAIYDGHGGSTINSIAWSPRQHVLATAGSDGTVHVWNTGDGRPITIFRNHSGNVSSLAWSPNGTSIVSGGDDASVQIWEASTGRTISIYRGQPAKVLGVAWSPDTLAALIGLPSSPNGAGSRVACGREDGLVEMWDTATDRESVTYRYSAPVTMIGWSPDGRRFAFANADRTVQLWDTTSNLRLFTFYHTGPVNVMAWSPNGKYIASSDGAIIQVWMAS